MQAMVEGMDQMPEMQKTKIPTSISIENSGSSDSEEGPNGSKALNINDDNTLYVGNLSSNMGDERLFAIFTQYGQIVQSHILRDTHTNDSRKFGYVTFQNKNCALNALNAMRYVFIDGLVLKVNWKKDNPKWLNKQANLYIENLDDSITEKELFFYLEEFGDLITVFIRRDNDSKRVVGYGHAQFRTVKDAQNCIQHANGKPFKGRTLVVESSNSRYNKPNNLNVRNIPSMIKSKTEAIEFLEKTFGKYGKIVSTAAKFQEKYDAYNCFVSFEESDSANLAVESLNGKEIDGTTLLVTTVIKK